MFTFHFRTGASPIPEEHNIYLDSSSTCLEKVMNSVGEFLHLVHWPCQNWKHRQRLAELNLAKIGLENPKSYHLELRRFYGNAIPFFTILQYIAKKFLAGRKGRGSRFSKSLAAELSVLRVEREREKELLKKENKSLKIQLRDTAEAVHAAGELLVRLREAEHAASIAQENFTTVHQENEMLKKQIEKVKRKHKMEMITMKQYMAESKLPESALQPGIWNKVPYHPIAVSAQTDIFIGKTISCSNRPGKDPTHHSQSFHDYFAE